MDNPARATVGAIGSTQGGVLPGKEDLPRQAQTAGRQVSQRPADGQEPAPRKSGEASEAAGATPNRKSIRSRLSTVLRMHTRRPSLPDTRLGEVPVMQPPPHATSPGRVASRKPTEETISEMPPPTLEMAVRRFHLLSQSLLPWLTPLQNAKIQYNDRQLQDIRNRPYISATLQSEISTAVSDVSEVEKKLLKSAKLAQKATTETVSDFELRELSCLVHRYRAKIPALSHQMEWILANAEAREFSMPAVSNLATQLWKRLVAALGYLCSDAVPWDAVIRRIETTLPIGPGMRAVVVSRTVPGIVFGTRLAGGYPPKDGAGALPGERYKHVTDLAQTCLTNSRGQTLFSGLWHGIFHADELTGEFLAGLSAGERQALVGDFLNLQDSPVPGGPSRAQRIDTHSQSIAANTEQAELDALKIKRAASRRMARETATAALVINPDKLNRALAGETVDLDLFNVCLLAPGELHAGGNQRHAFYLLGRESPLTLQVCGPLGAPRDVLANLRVRHFLLAADSDRFSQPSHGIPCREVASLLGPEKSGQLGGALGARVNAMKAGAAALHSELAALEQDRPPVPKQGDGHDGSSNPWLRRSALRDEKENLDKTCRTLEQAGQQLRDIWAQERDWPAGAESSRKAAARLALAGYLMGEIPALSCASGQDHTRQLDAEIKFLATVADNSDGHLPPVDQDMAEWEQTRNAFTPQRRYRVENLEDAYA